MLRYKNCSEYERMQLENFVRIISTRIRRLGVPSSLRNCVEEAITGYREVIIDCRPEVARCRIHRGVFLPPNEIEICPRYRLPALLFHELVHYCGGNEFDAEVYENYLFTSGEGATKPDPTFDKGEFEKSGYKGMYAYLSADSIYNSEHRYLMGKLQLIDW